VAHEIVLGLQDRELWERRARRLAWVSLLWHVAEGLLAVGLGLAAGSVALVAFGADSFIEATAGGVVLWRLTGSRRKEAHRRVAERRAARLIAVTFYLLAAYIVVQATYALVTATKAEPSPRGIALAVVTLIAMPPLAIAKQRIGHRIRSCATRSEGTQNMLCAYLSAALLVGLGVNAFLGWWWADPVIAVVIGAVAVREGRSSWRGDIECC
jgi:divalent metal cation (Fe/Co/Zn/Cd) transporter